jgi:hypothetical protein
MPKTLKWQKTVAFSDVWPKAMPQAEVDCMALYTVW